MPVEVIEANRSVFDSAGYIALQRGPLIYCIENAAPRPPTLGEADFNAEGRAHGMEGYIENADYQNSEIGSNVDVRRLSVTEHDLQNLTAEFVPDLLGGICVLRGKATLQISPQDLSDSPSGRPLQLYYPHRAFHTTAAPSKVSFTAIPYYAWAHREPGAMLVWIPLHS